MNRRYFEWIWHVRDSVEVPVGLSNDEAMTRLKPLFHERGTSYERVGDTLTFGKKGQPAQDKMSVYDSGELRLETGANGSQLRYHLISKAFLYCFLAPLLFLAFAGMNTVLSHYAQMAAEASPDTEKEKDLTVELPQSAVDKFLGAPAPEISDEEEEEGSEGPSPTPAYVFAVLFCIVYASGRILEAKLVKRLFRRRLQGLDSSGKSLRDPSGPSPAAG